jgi:hypothetical protein
VDVKSVDLKTRVRYIDGEKYVNQRSEASFQASVKAFSLPASFDPRKSFSFSYRVMTGTGSKIHLVYNAMATTPTQTHEQERPGPFGFDISTMPVPVPESNPSAHLIIDTTYAWPEVMSVFEDILYGSESQTPRMPLPSEILDIFEVNARYRVIDNGDGTFTLEMPDEDLDWISPTLFETYWPKIVYIDSESYLIESA